MTRADGFYEPGVFDVRSAVPRPTAIASMVQSLAAGQEYNHPLLDLPGWWQRSQRLFYPPVSYSQASGGWVDADPATVARSPQMRRVGSANRVSGGSSPPLLIAGATGTLGQAFARLCEIRGIPYYLLSRQEMDITDSTAVEQTLTELQPWAVINAAGYVRVDDAEREPYLCHRINAEGATILAKACADRSIAMAKFSSDLVFDGNRTDPYRESHQVAPLNVYGQSKAIAEQQVLMAHPDALVIRTYIYLRDRAIELRNAAAAVSLAC